MLLELLPFSSLPPGSQADWLAAISSTLAFIGLYLTIALQLKSIKAQNNFLAQESKKHRLSLMPYFILEEYDKKVDEEFTLSLTLHRNDCVGLFPLWIHEEIKWGRRPDATVDVLTPGGKVILKYLVPIRDFKTDGFALRLVFSDIEGEYYTQEFYCMEGELLTSMPKYKAINPYKLSLFTRLRMRFHFLSKLYIYFTKIESVKNCD